MSTIICVVGRGVHTSLVRGRGHSYVVVVGGLVKVEF